jgi:hypothetical protein
VVIATDDFKAMAGGRGEDGVSGRSDEAIWQPFRFRFEPEDIDGLLACVDDLKFWTRRLKRLGSIGIWRLSGTEEPSAESEE